MDGLIVLGIVIIAVVVFDLLAFEYGADTRPGFGIDRAPDRIIPV